MAKITNAQVRKVRPAPNTACDGTSCQMRVATSAPPNETTAASRSPSRRDDTRMRRPNGRRRVVAIPRTTAPVRTTVSDMAIPLRGPEGGEVVGAAGAVPAPRINQTSPGPARRFLLLTEGRED